MTEEHYNWKRFWHQREEPFDDERFLWWDWYKSDSSSQSHLLSSLEEIAHIPCLILLGEPGIGKTKEMEAYKDSISGEGEKVLFFELSEYGESEIDSEIFQDVRSSLKKGGKLYLFLDSLDEGLLNIKNLARIIKRKLGEFYKEIGEGLLFLRISCRAVDWPSNFESDLKNLWGENNVQAYVLAPLREVDVVEATRKKGLDTETFLQEVDRLKAKPWVRNPIMLNFLLNIFRKDKRFPETRWELYLKGCERLCEESNDNRRDVNKGKFNEDQRIAIAARIAAITIFSNRYAIWKNKNDGSVPKTDLLFGELRGGKEHANENDFEVNDDALKETLNTGLFSVASGAGRFVWAHKSYAEFLAAYYISVQHKLKLPQVKSLIFHNNGIIPQLRETAVWLATRRSDDESQEIDVFQEIMEIEPTLLLGRDWKENKRKDLVEKFFDLCEQENFKPLISGAYEKLDYPGLAEQLKSRISAKNDNLIDLAISIAKDCKLQSLQDDILRIALNLSKDENIRFKAASTIVSIGNEETKAKLKPLASLDNELKWCGLLAVWPKHLSAEELFDLLIMPAKESHSLHYHKFISTFLSHIEQKDLPIALRWVKTQIDQQDKAKTAYYFGFEFYFEDVVAKIMLKAWDWLDEPGVLENFAKVVLVLLQLQHCYQEIINKQGPSFDQDGVKNISFRVRNDHDKRRKVIKEILTSHLGWTTSCLYPLITYNDIPWLIDQIHTEKSEEKQKLLAELIVQGFNISDQNQRDEILTARKDNPFIAVELDSKFKDHPFITVGLDIEFKVDDFDKRHEEEFKIRTERNSLAGKIIPFLDQIEQFGNSSLWWELILSIFKGVVFDQGIVFDLSALSEWKTIDSLTKDRMLKVAKRYLNEQSPCHGESLEINDLDYAAYAAFLLLQQESPDFPSIISDDIWKKWAFAIAACGISSREEENPYSKLTRTAYQRIPDEIIKNLSLLIDSGEAFNNYNIIDKFKDCWDERLIQILLSKAKDMTLEPRSVGFLLGMLIDHKVEEAVLFAKSLIPSPLPTDKDKVAHAKAIKAALALANYTEDAGWTTIWTAFQQDPQFGREVMEELDSNNVRKLTEDQLADLYIWLEKQSMLKTLIKPSILPNDLIWRNRILEHLKHLGTLQSCKAISLIKDTFPGIKELDSVLQEAEIITRRQTWEPPQPKEIFELVRNQEKRLVQSGEELLDLIIESLEYLNLKLQGETPAAIDLWNHKKEERWPKDENDFEKEKRWPKDENDFEKEKRWPKDENNFSDYVKRHLEGFLKGRGVIVNREVEIRRSQGGKSGERVDIHVDAIKLDESVKEYDKVTVIIEVKGCWHKELDNAMENQLIGQYLKDTDCQHGLYLIGWFLCSQWNKEDWRCGASKKFDLSKAREYFEKQAKELSDKHNVCVKAFVLNTALR